MVDVPLNKDGSVDYEAIMQVMSDPQWEKRVPMLKALENHTINRCIEVTVDEVCITGVIGAMYALKEQVDEN